MTAVPWWEGPLAGFDTETTGVDPEEARIVTATITLHLPGQPDSAREWLVNPGIDIPEDASKIHGVTTEHARASGTPAKDAVAEIAMGLAKVAEQGLPVVIFNATYDLTLLDRELRRYDVGPMPRLFVIDPFVIDKTVDKWRRGKRTLSACCEHYKVTLDDAHTSTADAVAAVNVARAIGAAYGDVGGMSLIELHQAQVEWRAQWAVEFEEYLRKQNKDEKVNGAWPLVPYLEVPAQDAPAPVEEPKKRTRAKKTTAPAEGVDRIPKRVQGYYRDPETGDRLRSVTTILDQGTSKPQLIFWAGNTVADCAMEFLPKLVRASRTPDTSREAWDWLRRAHTRKKEERGEVGTAVHRLIEAHILGQPVPSDLLNDEELKPYLEQFLAFVGDFAVEFTASEMVVANPGDGWAGTLDFMLRSRIIAEQLDIDPALDLMGDTKTGGELDVKGVYPEAGMQMAAYRKAKVAWLRDGTKVDMPTTAAGIVLHLRPEGYRVIPVRSDDEVYAKFLHVKEVADWTSGLSKSVVGEALPAPAELKASA